MPLIASFSVHVGDIDFDISYIRLGDGMKIIDGYRSSQFGTTAPRNVKGTAAKAKPAHRCDPSFGSK